ncbi:MAG TPA: hypothetical protein VFH99_00490 [Candidatus Saccharimonadales bacterium]|nr:hypothetical protein [Candidatus Saccharimonadales bacterium]
MLKFAHRPPRGPEDITLSEGGKLLLKESSVSPKVDGFILAILGRSAFTEIADSFDGDKIGIEDTDHFYRLTSGLREQSELILAEHNACFENGLHSMYLELDRRGEELPA